MAYDSTGRDYSKSSTKISNLSHLPNVSQSYIHPKDSKPSPKPSTQLKETQESNQTSSKYQINLTDLKNKQKASSSNKTNKA